MLEDTKQQALVRDGIPPQGWQLRMIRVRHPDFNHTDKEKVVETDVTVLVYVKNNASVAILCEN